MDSIQAFRKAPSRAAKISCFFIGIMVLSAGFAASGPVQEPGARIRVYQRGGYIRSGFSLKINGQLVNKKIRPRTWFEVEVPRGKLELETSPELLYPTNQGKSFVLEVEEGKVYYLEAVLDYEFLISRMFLVQRDSARAMKEMKRFKEDKNAKTKLE